ncbi:MAG TPA: sigma-70 family RNA polymerase sigma factor [Anaeromyxobacteraceae bacterium]|nr:sigma-70 family RNA polymerase sigma factor [Anaeromyxobacteraceae bacterium]
MSTAVQTMAIVPEPGVASAVDFAALVAAEQGTLLGLARRFLRDPEEARDLVQNTLADAFERLGSLRDPGAAPAWLRRILVSRALNLLRRRRLWNGLRSAFGAGAAEAPGPFPAPDAAVAEAARRASLARAVEALPARQAAAFTLRYLEGLGLDDVAAAMGCGRGTVRTHLVRALSALRAELGEPEEGEP